MSSLLPCTQNSRLMPKPNSSTKPLAFGNSLALTIRKPNSNVIAPYTASHPNKHNIGTPTHHPTCNDRVPLFLLGIVSSHFPDCQSGHIVHCPMEKCLSLALRTEEAAGSVAPTIDKKSGVLRPLARHWMPVSSVDSGLYPDYFASKRHFHPLSPCKMKIFLASIKNFL